MTTDRIRTEPFLPLTPIAFEILLALAEGEQHGYRIMQDVNGRAGSPLLHAGTLYRALARLLEQALIEELDERPTGHHDERRRYYRLSERGRAVAVAEAQRLAGQLATARARRLVGVLP
jgi:DNA-binding PadR family transcriptional regulator